MKRPRKWHDIMEQVGADKEFLGWLTTHKVKESRVLVLSGPQCSGKSTFVEALRLLVPVTEVKKGKYFIEFKCLLTTNESLPESVNTLTLEAREVQFPRPQKEVLAELEGEAPQFLRYLEAFRRGDAE